MAKLSMVTGDDPSDFSIEVQPSESTPASEPTLKPAQDPSASASNPAEAEPDLLALANTSDTPISIPQVDEPEEDIPLLDEALMANLGGKAPKRTPQANDITKNPLANTLAISLLSFGVIGGLAFIWWGLGAAKARTSIASDIDTEQIIEDAKDAQIEELQQQLYEQRASVALRSLKAEPEVEVEPEVPEAIAPEPESAPQPPPPPSRAVSRPAPRPTSSPSPRPRAVPPPPRPAAPQPIQRASASSTPSAPAEPEYDSLSLWGELANLGKVSTDEQTEAIAFASQSPSPHPSSVPVMASWSQSDIPVVSVNASHSSPFPAAIAAPSPGEHAILAYNPVVQGSEATIRDVRVSAPAPTPAPASVESIPTVVEPVVSESSLSAESSLSEWADQVLATLHGHSDPGMAEALLTQSLASLPEAPTLLASQSSVLHQDPAIAQAESWSEAENVIAPDESLYGADNAIVPDESWFGAENAIAQLAPVSVEHDPFTADSTFNSLFELPYERATVAIGQLAKAKVITPIVWDMSAPRPSDGIFTVELTEALVGINEQVVLPEGTQLVADVSYVSSEGHVYQSIVAIILPNGEQIPVPVIGHEADTNTPITPLVVRGRKGRALMADVVERRGSNRLGNMLLSGVVAGVADAADNALQPSRSVQVNQGGGSATVATQDNVRNATTAFARGFFETTSDRLVERLDEEPAAVQIYQVDTGEKVSVVVNGLMDFRIPVGGWPE